MKAIVVYDSVFGNTQKVAEAIASALGAQAQVQLVRPSDEARLDLARSDLLGVGAPTRRYRPTEGIAALLKRIPSKALKTTRVAAFDTRFKADELKSATTRFVVKTGGYAAKRISSQLEKAGGSLIAPPEGFYVDDTEGPLKPGELERAAAWATSLLRQAQSPLGA
jgi:flavodoxin